MLQLQGGDNLCVLGTAGDRVVDFGTHLCREPWQLALVDDQATGLRDLFQHGDRAGRVLGVDQVVRDVHREPLRRDAGPAGRELDQRRQAAGHVHPVHRPRPRLDHGRVAGVRGDQQIPGVRGRPRDRLQTDGLAHLEVLGEFDDDLGDLVPAEVWLRAVHHQERFRVVVPEQVQCQPGHLHVREVIPVESHHRAPGAVVVDVVDAQFGNFFVGQVGGHV